VDKEGHRIVKLVTFLGGLASIADAGHAAADGQVRYVTMNLQRPIVNEVLQAEECKYGCHFICTRKITT
jgi:hypothetical protein